MESVFQATNNRGLIYILQSQRSQDDSPTSELSYWVNFLVKGAIEFFGFPVLAIFEFGFSGFARKIFGFSVLVSTSVVGFSLFDIRFLLIKSGF